MTQLGQQLGAGIPLNPDAAQPPFPVWMALPAGWSLLDTRPGSWKRSANELLNITFRGSRLPAAERRTFLSFIEGLVADCQAAGACVSLIMVGRREGGGAASAGIHIAFADDGVPASLGRVQDAIPRGGTRSEIDSGVGPAMLQRERMTMLIPGTGRLAALTSLQIFAPIPETTWTVALSTASAYPEITDRLESLLVEIARSISVRAPGAGDDGDEAMGGEGSSTEGDGAGGGSGGDGATGGARGPADAAGSGPRIIDGFGGLITRRLGSEPDTGPATAGGPADG